MSFVTSKGSRASKLPVIFHSGLKILPWKWATIDFISNCRESKIYFLKVFIVESTTYVPFYFSLTHTSIAHIAVFMFLFIKIKTTMMFSDRLHHFIFPQAVYKFLHILTSIQCYYLRKKLKQFWYSVMILNRRCTLLMIWNIFFYLGGGYVTSCLLPMSFVTSCLIGLCFEFYDFFVYSRY